MKIQANKMVTLTYSILDDAGLVLEQNDVPVSYVHGGHSDLFEKIERALEGKTAGDAVDVTLPPAEGFGEHDSSLTFTDDIDNVPPEFRRLGAEVEMQNAQGEPRTFVVTKIENGRLTVDCNHPFAGKTVHFHVEVMSVRDATADELRQAGANPNLH
ncbi:MAG: FKBP-type peptidyl-prolyl cis-trans isomerase [Gammaproteobacteria bacterium]|nr:FKBP-type peptidyl-prolyl cis-trans isomerase [Gammaproteobacteria bacterium]MBU2478344.1 FKBP-type peptidyl-prolyl cis-trans isomerase [Gammaproteobacteria bacterium]